MSDDQKSSQNNKNGAETRSSTNNQAVSQRGLRKDSPIMAWPLIRRLETAAFMAMFIAVPLFAFRVVDYTARQLALNNAAHELVKDIRRVKEMSTRYNMPITVESARSQDGGHNSYLIRSDKKTIEEVVLPTGVSMVGEVTFGVDGAPDHPATFDVSLENRAVTVMIDKSGMATMP